MRTILAALVVCGAAGLLACAGEEEPLVRWSFEHDDGWRAQGCTIERTQLKAHDGGWSLRLDVAFPQPASLSRPLSVDMDLVGRMVYHVWVPEAAPADVKTLLFVKDKDGLWFQHQFDQALKPGGWNAVSLDVAWDSPHLRPAGHHAVWSSVHARRMSEVGVRFYCTDRFGGSLYLDRVEAWPVEQCDEPLRVLGLGESALKVGRYEKFEVTFTVNRPVTNPFDPDQIRIDAIVQCPDGAKVTVPAFYHQGYERRLRDGEEELIAVGPGEWKVRFAPAALGRHTWWLRVAWSPDRKAHGSPAELVTGKRSFECVESESRGFVRVSKRDPLYFEFDNGEWFYPIGHNVRGPSDPTPRATRIQRAIGADALPDHGTFAYDTLLQKMADHGENFAEVWMAAWWLGLEWTTEWRHYGGLNWFNLQNAWRLDHLVELAETHDLYLHLVLDNHGKASTWCDPEWEDSPYNRRNGGFLDSPEELFADPVAKANYKKRLRYFIARWGYSTRIAGLELWSEIDLVGDSWDFHADDEKAKPKVAWHREMTDYLDHLDPWGHLVTTHFSTDHTRLKPALVALPGIDYAACDAYKLGGGSIVDLVLATAKTFNTYRKPGFVTEFGGRPFGSNPPAGLRADLHGGLWATYLTPTAGTPLFWWFQFIDAADLYGEFRALAAFHAGEDRRGEGLANRDVAFPTPHRDLAALSLQNDRKAYVWVYSRRAMLRWPAAGREPQFTDIAIALSGLRDGGYRVEVWDTRQGEAMATLDATAQDGTLTIPLPPFRIDCALKVRAAKAERP